MDRETPIHPTIWLCKLSRRSVRNLGRSVAESVGSSSLRILEAQPIASYAMVELLSQAINDGLANLDACGASIQEIKKGWSLP